MAPAVQRQVVAKKPLQKDLQSNSVNKPTRTSSIGLQSKRKREQTGKVESVPLKKAKIKASHDDLLVSQASITKHAWPEIGKTRSTPASTSASELTSTGNPDVVNVLTTSAQKKAKTDGPSSTHGLPESKNSRSHGHTIQPESSQEIDLKSKGKRKAKEFGELEDSASKKVKTIVSDETLTSNLDQRASHPQEPSEPANTHLRKASKIRKEKVQSEASVRKDAQNTSKKSSTVKKSQVYGPFLKDPGSLSTEKLQTRKQPVTTGQIPNSKNGPVMTNKQLQDQAKREKRAAALARKENADTSQTPNEAAASSWTEEPIEKPHVSQTDAKVEASRAQYYRKDFRGLTSQPGAPCANPVLQCLATVPKVANAYKQNPSGSVKSKENFDDDLSSDDNIVLEQLTGSFFRELSMPGKSTVSSSLYHQKIAHGDDSSEELVGGHEADPSSYLDGWVKRHNDEYKKLHPDSTQKTPLEKLLNGKMRFSIECPECHECTTGFENFTSPIHLPIPANVEEVSLEHCIDEYFKTQSVPDHECTRCKKPVMATKKTWFMEMPSNIIFSVDRTDASGAKICTPIGVTTRGTDFRRWYNTNQATTRRMYELSSMVEHCGDSASSGEYFATCRVHGSGKEMGEGLDEVYQDDWRTIRDEEVSKPMDWEQVCACHRNGQLFFLQRVEAR